MTHVSRPKFDAESESGNQNDLYRKCLLESGNYFTISQIIHMANVSIPKFDTESESGNQICLSGKCFSESGNYFTISRFIYMAHVSRLKFDAESESGNQKTPDVHRKSESMKSTKSELRKLLVTCMPKSMFEAWETQAEFTGNQQLKKTRV